MGDHHQPYGEYRAVPTDPTMHFPEIICENQTIRNRTKKMFSSFFSRKTLKKRLPCLQWIPGYSVQDLVGDLVAGLTVSLLIIPQGLAYGLVAGLTPNYGLYSAFMGGIVYFLLGSTRELSIGPTAIMSLMTYQYSSQGGANYAIILCFVSGVIEIFAGLVNLGFLINFISQPVISGFTSAAAVTIASSQLKGLFGLKVKSSGVIDTWYQVCAHIQEARWQDSTLGLCCILVLSVMKEIRSWKLSCLDSCPEKMRLALKKLIFYLSVGRNALIVFIASVIAFSFRGENQPFSLTGEVASGIPTPSVPEFTSFDGNSTLTFVDKLRDMGVGVVMVPFISILDDVAVVSASSKGRPFDVTQEMIALGAINFVGAFFGSIPTTASLSRTAVNITSGVRTPAGGLVTGAIVLLSLAFLTPYFKFIPKATLSAVIMCAVMHMFDYEILKPLWRTKRFEIIHLAVTFTGCLFIGLEWGILLGIGVNIAAMLFSLAKPAVHVVASNFAKEDSHYIFVTPTFGILYPNTSHLKSAIIKAGAKEGRGVVPVVLNCSYFISSDYTSLKGLVAILNDFDRRKQPIFLINMKPDICSALRVFRDVTVFQSLGSIEEELTAAAKQTALKESEATLNVK